ncbi:hypothetical protein ACW7DJ_00345 (plasmid) [Mammaliicoccus sciuri]|uniref:hypothetical protein n=1 Tax=Mammaliicoccus sciuri TaxID=1296 RepID=UPI002DC047AF|nr:hypothetical protein [Mammaliicoccus sciuri]MEB5648573.1 hypothetical protein [Mammaliicoccus sciuri]
MVINNNLNHTCKDISDDLLYLSEILYDKSEDNNVDLSMEYEMLQRIINRIKKINEKN